MTLSATIKHHAPGRLRLQFSEEDFEREEIRDAIQVLRRSPSLRRVQGNPVTRTLLIEADDEELLQSALQEVTQAKVIQLRAEGTSAPHQPLRFDFVKLRKGCDRFFKEATGGRIDFHTASVLALAVLGVKQMAKGSILPAGLTLLMYAAGVAEMTAEETKP